MNIRMMSTAAIGIAVVAFAVGGYLGGVFPGLGPGQGFTGTGEDLRGRDVERPPASSAAEADLAGIVGDANRMLLVHVDSRNYSIEEMQENKAVLRSTTLDEIAELARSRPGTVDGIRVRVTRTKSSKAIAEIALRDVLIKSGLKVEEIEWANGPPP
jgi:hypothetical protein